MARLDRERVGGGRLLVNRVSLHGALLLLLIAVAVLLRLSLADERALEVDDVFSLAMATGHSLEHPAAEADPTLPALGPRRWCHRSYA